MNQAQQGRRGLLHLFTAAVLALALVAVWGPVAATAQEDDTPSAPAPAPQRLNPLLVQRIETGPAQAPQAPSSLRAHPISAGISLDWQAAVAPGTDPVQTYLIRSTDGRVRAEVPGGATWAVIPAQGSAGASAFEVIARNQSGDSPPSAPSPVVAPAQPIRSDTAVLAGRITTWSGEPVEANLRVTKSYSDLGAWGVSGPDGRFRLDAPTGVVILDVSISKGAGLQVSTVLRLSADGLEQDLMIPDAVDVPVEVRDAAGRPVADAGLQVGGKPQSTRPKDNGSVPFELMPGVVVQGGTWVPYLKTDAQGRATFQVRQSVESTYLAAQVNGQSLKFPTKGLSMGGGPCPSPCTAPVQVLNVAPDTVLTGRLVTRSGSPVPAARIQLSGYGKTQVFHDTFAVTDPDGSYSIDAPIGRPSATLDSLGSPNGPYFMLETSLAVDSGPITLTVPDPVDLDVFVLGAAGPVDGACVWINEPDSIENFDSARIVPFDIAPGVRATGNLAAPTRRTGPDGRAVLPVVPSTDVRTLTVSAEIGPYGCGPSRLTKASFDTTAGGTTMQQVFDLSEKRPIRVNTSGGNLVFLELTDSGGDVQRIQSTAPEGLVAPGAVRVDARAFIGSGSLETRFQFPITVTGGAGDFVLDLDPLSPQSQVTVRTVNRDGPVPYQNVEVAAETTSFQECLDENPLTLSVRPVPGVEVPGCFSAGGAIRIESSGQTVAGNLTGRVGSLQVRGPLQMSGYNAYLVAGQARDVRIGAPSALVEIPLNRPTPPTTLTLTPPPDLLGPSPSGRTAGEYLLSWESPEDLGSGQLLSFDVGVVPLDGAGAVQRIVVAGDATSAMVPGLQTGSRYRISAAAVTSAGAGPASYAEVVAAAAAAGDGSDEAGDATDDGDVGTDGSSAAAGATGSQSQGSASGADVSQESVAGSGPGSELAQSSGGIPLGLLGLLVATAGFILLWYVWGPRRDKDRGAGEQ